VKDVYTTTEVAKACHISSQIIIKAMDAGQLEGFRVPGSRDRRFTRGQVEKFQREQGLPYDVEGHYVEAAR
jgi:hypothetical protein